MELLTDGKVAVAKIIIATQPVTPFPQDHETVVVMTGFHLEETSGPTLVLDARRFVNVITPILASGRGVVVYPVVNQYGLNFPANSPNSNLVRRNKMGINYNSGWGSKNPAQKTAEGILIENDLLETSRRAKKLFLITYHEDSTNPRRGYAWVNGTEDEELVYIFAKLIRRRIEHSHLLDIRTQADEGGTVIDRLVILNSTEKRKKYKSTENWFSETFNSIAVTIEAPFNVDMETRVRFLELTTQSALDSFLK